MTQTEAEFLQSYDASKYEKPSVSTDIVVFSIGKGKRDNYRQLPKRHLQILLIRRKNHPFKDCWALPGGFVNVDESLRDAAARELFEETGPEQSRLMAQAVVEAAVASLELFGDKADMLVQLAEYLLSRES